MALSPCGRCGRSNPPTATTCRWCGAALAPLTSSPPLSEGYRALPAPATPLRRRSTSADFYIVSVPLLIVGVLLLVVAVFVSASFNRTCAQNPACAGDEGPNPGWVLAASAVALIVIGVVYVGIGASRRSGRSGNLSPRGAVGESTRELER